MSLLLDILEPTTEGFSFQGESKNLGRLEEILHEVILSVHSSDMRDGADLKGVNGQLVKEMEEILKDRFGLDIKIVGDKRGQVAAIFVPAVEHANTIATNSNDIYELVTQYAKQKMYKVDKSDKGFEDAITSDVIVKDELGGMKKLLVEMKRLEFKLEAGDISVDREKMYVRGADGINMLVVLDVCSLVEYGMNEREILATILHEVGHAMNSLESMVSRVVTTQLLVDEFSDIANRPVSDMRATMVKGNKIDDAVGKISKQLKGYYWDASFIVNNERAADSFATKLGYGGDLVTGLNKLGSTTHRRGITGMGAWSIVILAGLLVISGSMLILSGNIYGGMMLLGSGINTLLMEISPALVLYIPHGDGWERANSIKTEIIKSLRKDLKKLSKQDYERAMVNIKTISSILENGRRNRTVLNWVADTMTDWTYIIGMNDLNNRVERLVNNDLHVTKTKLLRRNHG